MTTKAKTAAAAPKSADEISVMEVKRGRATFCIIGTTPLIYHRLAQKAGRELLLPSLKKNRNEKETTLKHDPYAEFRDSVHVDNNPKGPTLLTMPCISFKCAMRNAAVDLPGSATKAAIGRLAYVENDYVPVYGIPKLHMGIVRMADMARTPDVRTRAIVAEWACRLTVNYVKPILTEQVVANLMAGAGMMQGVGDFRTEKGKGNFGSFELCEEDDPRFVAILKEGGRKAQVAAMKTPEPYDGEAAELLTWFTNEAKRREFRTAEDVASGIEAIERAVNEVEG